MFVKKFTARLLKRAWLIFLVTGTWLIGCVSPTPTPPPPPSPSPVERPFFKDAQNQPLANETFVIYCPTQITYNSAAFPPAQQRIMTDEKGQATSWPANCSNVVALQPQPSVGPGYDVYKTSWDPGTNITQDATRDILLTEHVLVVFNPIVSLAWEPAAGSGVLDVQNNGTVASLTAAFAQASSYLYEATNGQMLFGNVQIYTNGDMWNDADFRVLADNDRRPSANVGGMVETAVKHTLTDHPTFADLIFYPGHITMGRGWSRTGPAQGLWGEPDGYRTLVHEWGHYALFLFDEYLDPNNQPVFCECPHGDNSCAASIMDWHYDLNRTELWSSAESMMCQKTQQWDVYKAGDWQTLENWFNWQTNALSAFKLKVPTAPSTGTDLTFARYLVEPAASLTALATSVTEPAMQVVAAPATIEQPLAGQLLAQLYTVQREPQSDTATGILYQGSTLLHPIGEEQLGQMTLLGIPKEGTDQALYAGVNQFVPNSPYQVDAFSYTGALSLPGVAVNPTKWEPSLAIQYKAHMADIETQTAVIDTMTLTLTLDQPVGYSVLAQLCTPAPLSSGSKCHGPWSVGDGSVGQHVLAIAAKDLGGTFPDYSLLRLWGQAGEPTGYPELIRWLEIGRAGTGPGGGCAHAPTQDGNQTRTLGMTPGQPTDWVVDTENGVEARCSGLVAYMPVVNGAALNKVAVPNEVQGFVAPPVIVQDIPLDNFCSATQDSAVTISYDDLAVCQVAAQAKVSDDSNTSISSLIELFREALLKGEDNQEELARLCADILNTEDRLEETHLQLMQFDVQNNEWILFGNEARTVATDTNLISARTRGDGIFAIVFAPKQ